MQAMKRSFAVSDQIENQPRRVDVIKLWTPRTEVVTKPLKGQGHIPSGQGKARGIFGGKPQDNLGRCQHRSNPRDRKGGSLQFGSLGINGVVKLRGACDDCGDFSLKDTPPNGR